MSLPTSIPQRSSTPSAASCCTRLSTTAFSILKSGTPKRTRPPIASSRSNSTTRWPARRSCCAAAMPAGPEPTTATLWPVSVRGGCGSTQPSSEFGHAGGLAGRRPQAAGELGEVVGRVQLRDRVLEAVAVDEVVPVWDQVPERAPVVAEGDAAVHAAGALIAQLLGWARHEELLVVARTLERIAIGNPATLYVQEGSELAHQAATATCSPAASRRT